MTQPESATQTASIRLVEVLDQARRVVALLPVAEAVRQKLCHRTVAILLFDEAGRLSLRKPGGSATNRQGRWDVPARGPVLADESLLEAATRILETELGIHSERLRMVLELPAGPENNNEHLSVFSLTRSDLPVGPGEGREAGDFAFTAEELRCLLRDFRELVSPRFVQLAEAMSLKGQWRRP